MTRCIAYLENGNICGAPARHVDSVRGGMVCAAHAQKGRLPGESLKAWKARMGAERRKEAAEAKRQERLYRQARRVYNDEDRSPESDPHDVDGPVL